MMKHTLAAGILLGLSSAVSAQTWFPAEGIWQIDGANGSGLTLDVRDNAIGIGLYTYDDAGVSTWYSGAGTLTDGVLTADVTRLASAEGGGAPTVVDTVPLRVTFAAGAIGELQLDDGEPRAIRHAAFGAQYIDGLALPGEEDITIIPDLQGRWLFANGNGATDSAAAYDVTFQSTFRFEDELRFSTSPIAETPPAAGDPYIACRASDDDATYGCGLWVVDPDGTGPATQLSSFALGDLAPTRIAGAGDGWIGFRVPETANAPVSGIWQIVDRFGQGITIDVRPELVAVGVYGYTEDGDATWSLATGALDGDVMEADLTTFTGGSCINCDAATPTIGTVRPISLEFVAPTRALLTIGDDAPLALTLLPFGAAYLDKPIAGDPQGETFGPLAMPSLLGTWARTTVREQDEDEDERYPAVQFEFTEQEDASIDGGEISHLLAWTDAYPSPEAGEDRQEATLVLCGDESQEPTDTSCEMQVADGAITLPLPDIDRIATFKPWDASSTRIALTGEVDAEPVYLFRIPSAPAATPTR